MSHSRAIFVGLCLYTFGVPLAQIVRMIKAPQNAVYCAASRWDTYSKKYKQKLIQRLDKKLTRRVKNDLTAVSAIIYR